MPEHDYKLTVDWTGNTGAGTAGYRDYGREYEVRAAGKPTLTLSADPAFRGDAGAYNPEELLVASLSGCHMLWFLHMCADASVVVTEYRDAPEGHMVVDGQGGRFTQVVLRPDVGVAQTDMVSPTGELHAEANRRCFIANSVTFPISHEPTAYTTGAL